MKPTLKYIFILLSLSSIIIWNCNQKETTSSDGNNLLAKLLQSGSGTQEDSLGDFSNSSARSVDASSVDSKGSPLNIGLMDLNLIVSESTEGSKTYSKSIDCKISGKVEITATYDLSFNSYTDKYNKDVNIENYKSTTTYTDCSFRPGVVINSGTITFTESGVSKLVLTQSDTIVNTVSTNRIYDISTSISATITPPRRDSFSASLSSTIKETIETQKMKYTISSDELTKPEPVYIKGSVTGSVTRTGPRGTDTRDVNHSFEKTF